VEHLVLGSTRSLVPGVVLLALLAVGTSLTAAFRRTSWLWPVLFLGVTLASAILLPGYLALRAHLDPTFEGSSPTLPLGGAGGASALEMGGVALEVEMGTTPLPVLERRVSLSAVALESGTGTRAEVWTWYRARGGDALLASAWKPRTFGFLNGRLQGESQARAVKVKTGPPAAPPDFDPSWTEDRARQLLGDPDLIVRKDSPVFGRVTVLNYRNQLVLTFRNGALCGAQNLVMEAAP